MVRRGQQRRKALRDARQFVDAARFHGAHEADRESATPIDWVSMYDDANTVRVQHIVWLIGGKTIDFVINLHMVSADGWSTVEHIDCCHGHCHRHATDGVTRHICTLDSDNDVQRAFLATEEISNERMSILRGREGSPR